MTLHDITGSIVTALHQMTVVEVVAVVATFVSIYLTIRNNIWTWVWGLVAVLAYGYFFWTLKDYGNAGLNLIYYTPIQIYGWYAWLRFGPRRKDDLPIMGLKPERRLACGITTLALTILAVFLLGRLKGDPHPYADGVTTALCIVAQYLEVFKRIENWILWIVADVVYAFYLFPVQHDYLSTLLYVASLAMAIAGARQWRTLMRREPASAASPTDG